MIIQKYDVAEKNRRPFKKGEKDFKDRDKKMVVRHYDRYLNEYFYYTEVFKDFYK